MAIDNIYDLYNATLEADKPFVEAIVTQLKAEIEAQVSNNVFYFVFDLTPFFVETVQLQRNRIVDRVLLEMRRAGISCKPVGIRLTEGEDIILGNPNELPITTTPGFNSAQFDVQKLEINIKIRRDQEFMKTWC